MTSAGAHPAAATVARAEALTAVGRPEEALRLLAPLVASSPTDLAARLAVASAHLALRDGGRARHHASAAVGIEPTSVRAHVAVSLSCTLSREFLAGARAAQRAIDLEPRHPGGHVALASAGLNQAQHRRRTRSAAAAALELAPDDPLMHVLVAQSYMYNGRAFVRLRDRAAARRHLELALALDGGNAPARSEFAILAAMGWRPVMSMRRHVTVLAGAPLTTTSVAGVAFALTRMTLLLHVLAAMSWLAVLATRDSDRPPSAATVGVALLAVVAAVTLGLRIRAALGRAVVASFRRWAGADPRNAWWLAVLVVVLVAVTVAGLAPPGEVVRQAQVVAGSGLVLAVGIRFVGGGRA
ncbi:MAG: hypothetical protein ACRCYR_01325 [Phycicoccus sp.]